MTLQNLLAIQRLLAFEASRADSGVSTHRNRTERRGESPR